MFIDFYGKLMLLFHKNPNKEPAIKESEIEEVKKNWADGVERRLQAKLPVVPS